MRRVWSFFYTLVLRNNHCFHFIAAFITFLCTSISIRNEFESCCILGFFNNDLIDSQLYWLPYLCNLSHIILNFAFKSCFMLRFLVRDSRLWTGSRSHCSIGELFCFLHVGCSHYQDVGGCPWKGRFLPGIATLPPDVQL